eukprot:8786026-Pyramimonas_sp.AAC.1
MQCPSPPAPILKWLTCAPIDWTSPLSGVAACITVQPLHEIFWASQGSARVSHGVCMSILMS